MRFFFNGACKTISLGFFHLTFVRPYTSTSSLHRDFNNESFEIFFVIKHIFSLQICEYILTSNFQHIFLPKHVNK
jgi:hypothetical protein